MSDSLPPSKQFHAMVRLGHALQARGYHFSTCTPQTHNLVNARPDNSEARDLLGVFGWNRPFRQALLDDELFSALQESELLIKEGTEHWRSAVRWSSLGNQLYVHSGYPTDQSDAVYLGPDTYRFVRAIDTFLKLRTPSPVQRAVEIGAGAGPAAIHLAIAHSAAEVFAVDINPYALYLTQVNAELAKARNLRPVYSDLLQQVDGTFDLIVANPPYMADSEHRIYRDGGGELGSGISQAIIAAALPRLSLGGSLILYTGSAITSAGDHLFAHAQHVLQESPSFSWEYSEIDPDVYGEELSNPGYENVDRIAVVLLTVTRQK